MVQKRKLNVKEVKERFSNGEIDLSMSDLDEVPIKEIASFKNLLGLDLSNNRLISLPSNFAVLTNLTKLDLSKNEIAELPEDFGSLSKLKYLDLYKNNLERLPLSFSKLINLKFLDLKDNPLVPAIANVAGPCIDTKGCQQCAKKIVLFYKQLQEEISQEAEMRNKERQKQLQKDQKKKQEEKKKKKSEKKKQPKAVVEAKRDSNPPPSTKLKQNYEECKRHDLKKVQFLYKVVFVLVMIIPFFTWCLSSIKCSYTEAFRKNVETLHTELVGKFPEFFQPYGKFFGDYIQLLHSSTGDALVRLYTTLAYFAETCWSTGNRIFS